MTIDIKWLCEEGFQNHSVWSPEEVQRVMGLENDRREALFELNSYRSQVNRKEITRDKAYQKELEDKLLRLVVDAQLALSRLRNQVDCDICWDEKPDEKAMDQHASNPNTLEPFYCIGGYEDLGNITVLTETGQHILRTVSNMLRTKLRTFLPKSVFYSLPASMRLSVREFHDRLGCSGSPKCPACAELFNGQFASVDAPSYVTLLDQLKGTYWDKQLPMAYILQTSVSNETTHGLTGRRKHWYDRLACNETLEVVMLTGSSLAADSRPEQVALADHLQGLFRECNLSTYVEIQPTKDLAHSHASCLRILCSFPKSTPLCIATVTNTLDYSCSSLIHGNVKPKRVHAVIALVKTSAIADCLARRFAVSSGVRFPDTVEKSKDRTSPPTIAFTRLVSYNKKGRRVVQPIAGVVEETLNSITPPNQGILEEKRSCPFSSFLPWKETSDNSVRFS